jgi:hypothetical protein
MGIGMAVSAEPVGNRLGEIALLVALRAGQAYVLSNKAKICTAAVIESLAGTTTLEASGIVTLFALAPGSLALEDSAVSICVATVAAVENQSFEKNLTLRGTVSRARMAFFARKLLVPSYEREGGAGMAEL